MLDFISGHWLSVGAGVFMLFMALYGHYRGFLRIALTMSALLVSLLLVRLASPRLTAFMKENTQIRAVVQERLMEGLGLAELMEEDAAQSRLPASQRTAVEQMKLPRQMKEALLDNNNHEIYRILGVDTFLDYIGAYLADMVLNLIVSAVLFIAVYILLRVFMRVLDLVARLPVLSGMNQIAGAAAGFLQGLLWLWALCLAVDIFANAAWAQNLKEQIDGSIWLSFLYRNNLFDWCLVSLLRHIL